MSDIAVNCRVSVSSFKNRGQEGIVKFIGAVPGTIGNWVCVELDGPTGDMDGTKNGKEIFECKPGHGLMVRPNQVKFVDAAKDTELSGSPLVPVNNSDQNESEAPPFQEDTKEEEVKIPKESKESKDS